MQAPKYFSLMESAWEVSQPWAVTTNTTMTAISETLCQTHTHTHTHNRMKANQPHSSSVHSTSVNPQSLKCKMIGWLPAGMAGMDRENTVIEPHLKEKPSLPWFSHCRTHTHTLSQGRARVLAWIYSNRSGPQRAVFI